MFEFAHASALSKIGNLMTNFAALSFFIPTGHVLFQLGLMMAAANVAGSVVGVKMALKYGSGFIHWSVKPQGLARGYKRLA